MATTGKNLREGSALKRESILAAARELFLSDGFDRASMDAVAARAGVSKRTVYDYYGDKHALLLAVVQQAVYTLGTAVQRAIDENLTDVVDLKTSLVRLATSVTASALGSSDYSALSRLLSRESSNLPELATEEWAIAEPEDVIAERFAEFDRQGLLNAPDPRLAADHFVALTLGPSKSGRKSVHGSDDLAVQGITAGVEAFLRAYGPSGVVD